MNVPDRVKKALFEKGWTQKKLCAEIDISETGYKRMADNNTWKLETIEKIATVLGKPVVYFVGEVEENSNQIENPIKQDSFGEQVIQRMAGDIGEIRHGFEEQLRVKDRQLQAKDTQIELLLGLLGKPEGAIDLPTLFQSMNMDERIEAYKRLGSGLGIQLLTKSNIIPEQKQVAPRSQATRTRQ